MRDLLILCSHDEPALVCLKKDGVRSRSERLALGDASRATAQCNFRLAAYRGRSHRYRGRFALAGMISVIEGSAANIVKVDETSRVERAPVAGWSEKVLTCVAASGAVCTIRHLTGLSHSIIWQLEHAVRWLTSPTVAALPIIYE